MATYTSNVYASGMPTASGGASNDTLRVAFAATVPAGTALAVSDVIKLAPIPLQYKVSNFYLDVPSLDRSNAVVTEIGDFKNSTGIYANALTVGRNAQNFFRMGDSGTVTGIIGSQSATYSVKNSQRTNRDAADDFMMRLSTGPIAAVTSVARIIYGWVDFVPVTMVDTQ